MDSAILLMVASPEGGREGSAYHVVHILDANTPSVWVLGHWMICPLSVGVKSALVLVMFYLQ